MIDVHDSARLAELHRAAATTGGPEPDALVAGAGEALRRGAHDHAAALLDAALVLMPEHAAAWALYGVLEAARGRADGARRAYERAISLDDGDVASSIALAELYARGVARDPKDAERAVALANFLLLQPDVPAEITQRAAALKRALTTKGAEGGRR